MEFVTIGNPNNVADTTGSPSPVGAVAYTYNLGKYEVSRDMVSKANAAGNLGLTLGDMSGLGGNGTNRPATGISWYEAAKFVNWLNTSKGYPAAYKFSGANFAVWTNGDAGYQASNPYRNSQARFFLPSTDEWYKGAYGSPGGTWYNFATGSDTAPTQVNGGTNAGTVVYGQSGPTGPADITNAGGLSAYGTMAQGGNVYEWMETAAGGVNNVATENRDYRGGRWSDGSTSNQDSSNRPNNVPSDENVTLTGFRVASADLTALDTDGDGINDGADPDPVGTWNLSGLSTAGNFTNSAVTGTNTLKIQAGITLEYLIVGGGGGGGGGGFIFNVGQNGGGGGGGGAGQVRTGSITVNSFSNLISVGIGGSGGGGGAFGSGWNGATGVNGTTSSAFGISSAGGLGGWGASLNKPSGFTDGTGGFGGDSGSGFLGGDKSSSTAGGAGGGGGGSTGNGTTASGNGAGGSGGSGTAVSISGSAVTYGIGGKGGNGLSAGTLGASGLANSGNGAEGGGGGWGTGPSARPGGTGGSGVVIFRYPGSALGTGGTITSNTINGTNYTIHSFTNTGTNSLILNPQVKLTGTISGTGGVQYQGPGTITLASANTYDGTTVIDTNVTLQIGDGGTDGTIGAGNVTNNGILVFNRSDTNTYTNLISGTGQVRQIGSGTTILTANNTYSGLTTISNGVLLISAGGTIRSVTTVSSNAVLWVNGSVTTNVTVLGGGQVAGSGTIAALTVQSNAVVKVLTAATNAAGVWDTAGSITFAAGSKIDVSGLSLSQVPYTLIRGSSVSGTPALVGASSSDFAVTNVSSSMIGLTPIKDSDGDGLGDYQETQLGTNPGLADTDGDGINDNVEIGAGTDASGTWNLSGLSTAGNFTNSTVIGTSTLKIQAGIPMDYLIVGGGGAGGAGKNNNTGGAGGGGAGGFLTGSTNIGGTNLAGNVAIVVGAGGMGVEVSGANSSAFGVVALGGGGATKTGGSGGGGYSHNGYVLNGGSGTLGQGNNGANGINNSVGPGGGGAGSVGQSPSLGGAGGSGLVSSITGFSVAYAVGGNGGAVNGAVAGAHGTANRGNGGGGGGGNASGAGGAVGNGGSGIVVLRYAGSALGTGGTITSLNTNGTNYTIHSFTNTGTNILNLNPQVKLTGTISGTNGVQVQGPGTITLASANTYDGTTVIDTNVTLQIGDGGTNGTIGAGNVTNNGILVFNRSDTNTYTNLISGTGEARQIGSGTTILTANNTYSGLTTISNGVLQAGNGGTNGRIGTNAVAVFSNAFLAFNRSENFSLSNSVSGAGGLIKGGAGTLTFISTNNHRYTGSTVIQQGILKMSSIYSPLTATGYRPPQGTIIVETNGTLSFGGGDYFNQLGANANGFTNPITPVQLNGGTIDSSATVTTFTNLVVNGGTLRSTGGFGLPWGSFVLLGTVQVNMDAAFLNVSGSGNAISPGAWVGNHTLTFAITNGAILTNELPIVDYGSANKYSLVKAGSGKLILEATNTYSGATTIADGVLHLKSSGRINSSAVTVQSGGTFWVDGWAGTVTVAADAKIKGAGTITNLTVSSNGTVKITAAATNTNSAWNTAGRISFSPGSKLDVSDLNATNLSVVYYLVRGTSVTGSPELVGANGFSLTTNNNTLVLSAQDTDGDGLSDATESTLGTDPNLADTDGDGLSDKVETNTRNYVSTNDTGTDPLNADTDNDGWNDGVETRTGTFVAAPGSSERPVTFTVVTNNITDGQAGSTSLVSTNGGSMSGKIMDGTNEAGQWFLSDFRFTRKANSAAMTLAGTNFGTNGTASSNPYGRAGVGVDMGNGGSEPAGIMKFSYNVQVSMKPGYRAAKIFLLGKSPAATRSYGPQSNNAVGSIQASGFAGTGTVLNPSNNLVTSNGATFSSGQSLAAYYAPTPGTQDSGNGDYSGNVIVWALEVPAANPVGFVVDFTAGTKSAASEATAFSVQVFREDTGTSPLLADTDGDGVNDSVESGYGTSPNSPTVFNRLINGSFEDGTVKPATNSYLVTSQTNVPGWRTTATDGKIELWYTGFLGTAGADGNTLAELNANYVGTLYQDVTMTTNAPVSYAFLHRGRSGTDVTDFRIDRLVGGPGSAVEANVFSNRVSTGTAWKRYSGTAVVNVVAGRTYRFAYASISPTGATGNLVDGIAFGTDQDADGLTDSEEGSLGTDPAVSDTDGDGVNDSLELAAGTVPTNNTSNPRPRITNQPVGATKNAGQSHTFSVAVATNFGPFAYQWRKDGTNLSGATGSSRTLGSLQSADAGGYDVVITNSFGAVTSSVATLSITSQIATVTISGTNQTYNGTARPVIVSTVPTGLSNTVTYTWGANSLTNIAPTNAGTYNVVATVTDAGYTGTTNATLVIAKASQTVVFAPLSGTNALKDLTNVAVSASASSGLPVTLALDPANVSVANLTGNLANGSGSLTGIGSAGFVYLRASQVGDGNYLAAPDATFVMEVTLNNQSITNFAAISDRPWNSAPFTVSADAESGLPVTFSIVSGPATLTGTNLISVTNVGRVVVRASQAGDSSWNSAPDVDREFEAIKANQSLSFDLSSLPAKTYGDADFDLLPYVTSSLSPTLEVVSGPGSVSNNILTLRGGGTLVLKATQPGNDQYQAANATNQTLLIGKKTLTVTAVSTNRPYGTVNPAFGVRYAGFVGSDDESFLDTLPSVTTTVTITNVPGVYSNVLVPAGGSDGNYSFSYVPGNLTIDDGDLDGDGAADSVELLAGTDPSGTSSLPRPGITSSPQSTNVAVAGSVSFTVTATNPAGVTGGLSYQWSKNGIHIPDATNGVLAFNPVAMDDEGSYLVEVSNAYGSAVTPAAVLTVDKVQPLVTPPNASGITYGQTLGESVLSGGLATAGTNGIPVAGTFAFANPADRPSAGTTNVSVVFSPDDPNSFEALTNNVAVTVAPKALTVRADNQSRFYGEPNPALTETYLPGLVAGDAPFPGLSVTTLADANSAPGTYPITVTNSGSAANYAVTYLHGTLTVRDRDQDGDGIGDYAEGLAGTDPADSFDRPAQLASGASHTLYIPVIGDRVLAWGANSVGQCGLGYTSTNPVLSGVPVVDTNGAILSNAVAVAAGAQHSLILAGGLVHSAGTNPAGQLGLGSGVTATNRFTPIPGLTNVRSVVSGDAFALARDGDGRIWAWGFNGFGQLGNGNLNSQFQPQPIGGANRFSFVAAGAEHAVALDTNGVLHTWGRGNYGQLGLGGVQRTNIPSTLTLSFTNATNKVIQAGAGLAQTFVLTEQGEVWAFGRNDLGQLGLGTNVILTNVPTRISNAISANGASVALPAIRRLSVGPRRVMAIARNGTVYGWGYNRFGELGLAPSTNAPLYSEFLPTEVPALFGAKEISGGGFQTFTLDSSGALSATGFNDGGQLGIGSTNTANGPTLTKEAGKLDQTLTFAAPAGPFSTGTSTNLVATTTATNGLTVSFLSSDSSVAEVMGSTVRFLAPGNVTITASQSGDSIYNVALPVSRTLTVALDATVPVITLNDPATINLAVGDVFTDPGATAFDPVDGILTDNIMVLGTVNTTAAGSYTLTYRVQDPAGNVGEATRTVFVQVAPSLALELASAPVVLTNQVTGANVAPVDPALLVAGSPSLVLSNATVTIATGKQAGDTLSFSNYTGPLTTVYNPTSGVLRISGTANLAGYQAALRSVVFSTTNRTATDRVITMALGTGVAFTNGHVYELVGTTLDWPGARTAAKARQIHGEAGYLANVTSAEENAFLLGLLQEVGQNAWLGGSDTAGTGYRWMDGPEAGTLFWNGVGAGGTPVSGQYFNWNTGEPNDFGWSTGLFSTTYESYVMMTHSTSYVIGGFTRSSSPGRWNDAPLKTSANSSYRLGYLVEYGSSATDGLLFAGSRTIRMEKGTQTISFSPLVERTFGDATFNLTATSDSGLPVSYTSSDPAVATVSGSTLTIRGAGTATITASQAGDTNWNAATPVEQLLKVNPATPTITMAPTASAITYGQTLGDSALTGGSVSVPGSFAWTTPATVPSTSGSYSVTFTPTDTANYSTVTTSVSVTVNPAPQSITFNLTNSVDYGSGGTLALSATGGGSGNSVTFSSTDPSVAAVSGSTLSLVKPGTVTITANQQGNSNYQAATSVTRSLTIRAPQNITLESSATILTYGQSLDLTSRVNEILIRDNAVNQAIADYNPVGLMRTNNISGFSALRPYQVEVQLNIEGTGYGAVLGDYYAYLRHTTADGLASQTVELLNRLGTSVSDPTGSLADGINAVFSSETGADLATAPDPISGPLTGTYRASGLSVLGGMDPNGTWTLFVEDQSSGGTGNLVSWELRLTEVPMPGSTGPSGVTYEVTEGGSLVNLSGARVTALSGTGTVKIRASAAATSTYAAGQAEIILTLRKAPVSISSAPTASAIPAGQALSASTFTGGEVVSGTSLVSGAFTWNDPSIIPLATASYPVTFTPAEAANYETAAVNVPVTVNTGSTSPFANNINLITTNSLIDVPMPSAAVGGMTLEFWMKPASDLVSGTYRVVRKDSTSGQQELAVDLNYNSPTSANVAASVAGSMGSPAVASANVPDPLAWNHVAVVVSSSSVHVFINGVGGSNIFMMGTLAWTTEPMVFGKGLRGQLDDIRIYSGSRDSTAINADLAAPASSPFEANLEAYYKLDEGTGVNLIDATGKNGQATALNIGWGPGRSPGAWDLPDGDYSLGNDGSSLLLELGGLEGTTLYDQIFVRNGAATLDGIVNLMFYGSYTGPISGSWHTFDLIWAQNGIVFGDNYQLNFNQDGYTVDTAVVEKDGGQLWQATVRQVASAAEIAQAASLAKPALGLAQSPGPGGVVEMFYTYNRPTGGSYLNGQYSAGGVRYAVQMSTNLSVWSNAAIQPVSAVPAGEGKENATVKVISGSAKGFLRLKVSN